MSGGISEGGSAIAPAFMALRNLSYIHRPDGVFITPTGARVTGDSVAGIPFGTADRYTFLYYATRASADGRTFNGRPGDVTAMFGVTDIPDESIISSLERVAFSAFQAPWPEAIERCECGCPWLADRVPVANAFTYCRKRERFRIRLSAGFMEECRDGFPIDPAAVAQLMSAPATVDLYLWLRRRYHRRDFADVPLHGPGGVCEILKSARVAFRARQYISERMVLIHRVWPDCPYYPDLGARILRCKPPAASAAVPAPEPAPAKRRPRAAPFHIMRTEPEPKPAPANGAAPAAPAEQAAQPTRPPSDSYTKQLARLAAFERGEPYAGAGKSFSTATLNKLLTILTSPAPRSPMTPAPAVPAVPPCPEPPTEPPAPRPPASPELAAKEAALLEACAALGVALGDYAVAAMGMLQSPPPSPGPIMSATEPATSSPKDQATAAGSKTAEQGETSEAARIAEPDAPPPGEPTQQLPDPADPALRPALDSVGAAIRACFEHALTAPDTANAPRLRYSTADEGDA